MEIEKVIEQFKQLDLSKYPYAEIKDLFNKVGQVGAVIVTFHKGKSVMRARPNGENERFEKKSDLSFKPQRFNKTYQRASNEHLVKEASEFHAPHRHRSLKSYCLCC